jgi:hypothetical protein
MVIWIAVRNDGYPAEINRYNEITARPERRITFKNGNSVDLTDAEERARICANLDMRMKKFAPHRMIRLIPASEIDAGTF